MALCAHMVTKVYEVELPIADYNSAFTPDPGNLPEPEDVSNALYSCGFDYRVSARFVSPERESEQRASRARERAERERECWSRARVSVES